MEIIFLVGRVLFGGFFMMNGFNHFAKVKDMTGYAESKKLPAPKISVYTSGAIIFLAGLGIVLGVYTALSLWLLAIFLIITAFKMHNFWNAQDPQTKMMEMINFTKNLALAGAALMMLMIEAPWALSLAL